MPGAARIGPRKTRRIYLAEWRDRFGLTQKQLADRLGVADMTVSRWERGTSKLTSDVRAAVAEALGIDPSDLERHPDQPSADALLRGQPPEVWEQAIKIIKAIRQP
jgi:transcriptional regulator with XRE-family HTH domain